MKNNLSIILLLVVNNVFGQLSVSNIFEYQLGNLPNEEPTNLTTHFDQLNLSYRYNDILLMGRFEHFQNSDYGASYDKITQWSVSFNRENIDLLVGHFYQILGRGLLLRTYEIPGVIREQAGLRTRYGFYRDINGVRIGYENEWLEFKALRGRTLREDLPPAISREIRRENLIEAAQANFFISDWMVTTAYLRQNRQNEYKEFASFALAANLPLNVQIYGEYAGQFGSSSRFFDLKDKSAHALYLSMNTFLGPVFQQPLKHGADLVIYSLTKYVGGHSDLIAGAVLGPQELMEQIRETRTFLGNMADPFTGFLLMRSLETLKIRMQAEAENARVLADFLATHPKVETVSYLGHLREGDEGYEVFKRQCSAPGSMIAFNVTGGEEEAFRFLDGLKLIKLAVSLGGTESLAEHPGAMTHSDIPLEDQVKIGITPSMCRISVGLEDPQDLIADVSQALDKI